MKTAQFSAIYFDYALNDARAYVALFGSGMELVGINVVRNEAGADGFFGWTATVTYTEDLALIAYIKGEAPAAVAEVVEPTHEEAVLAFVELLQARETAQNQPFPATFSVEFGRVYARIIRSVAANQRSAYGFVTRGGDLLKAASWKGPAKNFSRGNIYGAKPLTGTSLYSIQ